TPPMADIPYSERILELADRWGSDPITEAEKKEFVDWYNQFDDAALRLPAKSAPIISRLEGEMLASIRQRMAGDVPERRPAGVVYRMRRGGIAAAVAAVVL